jgi:TonB family protein
LNWWCDEDGPDLFLSIGEYLTGDEVLVQYRFDTDPASTAQPWRFTAPLVYAPKDLIQAMTARAKTAAKVLIRVTDEAGAYTYTFDLDGSLKAAERARTRSLYADKRGRISRSDSLLLSLGRYAGDSLTFAAAFDQLTCDFERKDTDTVVDSGVPSSDQVFMESVVEERPEVLSGPALNYPDLLRQAGVQGRVLVQAIIDTTGRAEPPSVKVIQSPNPGFDQPAKNYVLRASFRPARIHGRAVRVLLNLPIDFKITR